MKFSFQKRQTRELVSRSSFKNPDVQIRVSIKLKTICFFY
jgi:hypothetical protein